MNVGKRANALSTRRELAAVLWCQRMAQAKGRAGVYLQKDGATFLCTQTVGGRARGQRAGAAAGASGFWGCGLRLWGRCHVCARAAPSCSWRNDAGRSDASGGRAGDATLLRASRCCLLHARCPVLGAGCLHLHAHRLPPSIKGAPPATGRSGAENQSALRFTCFGPAYARPLSLQNPALHLPPTATCFWLPASHFYNTHARLPHAATQIPP